MTFRDSWLAAVELKNSVLCAGLDPAEFEMGRGEKGLSKNINKREWALAYVRAVAPFSAAIKPNVQYWKDNGDMATLREIVDLAHDLDMVVIDDSKLADIGSTNDAGLFYSASKGFDAVTIAPYAGNTEDVAKQGKARDIGVITMCLMSNPEFATVKDSLVPIPERGPYRREHVVDIEGNPYVRKYIQSAHDAAFFDLDGIVVGAPSSRNHLTKEEVINASLYFKDRGVILLPGVGAQGGEADMILRYFGSDNVIVNVGRSLMFPKGSGSTSEDHQATAEKYQKMLNTKRRSSR